MIETARILYAVLAALVSIGFSASLRLRWDQLARGERVIRCGLITEHGAFVYGAWYALHHHFPASFALLVVLISMTIMLVGFADWLLSDVIPAHRATAART